MANQMPKAETLHPLVRQLIAEPLALRARCADKRGGAARKLLRLTHATPREVFVSLLNSYLYWTTGVRYTRTPILPWGLLARYKNLDDLYHRVAGPTRPSRGASRSEGGTSTSPAPRPSAEGRPSVSPGRRPPGYL
jgi:hypothetical protein